MTQHNPRRSVERIPTTLSIDGTHLAHIAFQWHFSHVSKWRAGLMSKGAKDGRSKRERPMTEGPTPPPLSEELIAKLQRAVNAAQRQRMSDFDDVSESESSEGQS
jgi:hypothetical protein